jgi:hypothetical protein
LLTFLCPAIAGFSKSRGGKKSGKSWSGYKCHVLVDEDSEIITAVAITPANKDDGSQLKPLLNQQEQAHELVPCELSGDKAYGARANLEHLTSKDIIGNISLITKKNNRGSGLFTLDVFKCACVHETDQSVFGSFFSVGYRFLQEFQRLFQTFVNMQLSLFQSFRDSFQQSFGFIQFIL